MKKSNLKFVGITYDNADGFGEPFFGVALISEQGVVWGSVTGDAEDMYDFFFDPLVTTIKEFEEIYRVEVDQSITWPKACEMKLKWLKEQAGDEREVKFKLSGTDEYVVFDLTDVFNKLEKAANE